MELIHLLNPLRFSQQYRGFAQCLINLLPWAVIMATSLDGFQREEESRVERFSNGYLTCGTSMFRSSLSTRDETTGKGCCCHHPFLIFFPEDLPGHRKKQSDGLLALRLSIMTSSLDIMLVTCWCNAEKVLSFTPMTPKSQDAASFVKHCIGVSQELHCSYWKG